MKFNKKEKAKMAKNDDDKVFDVAKPGDSKPDIGSKPMIIGHKSMASDPMVKKENDDSDSGKTPDDKKSKTVTTAKKLEPISEDLKSEDTASKEVDNSEENVSQDAEETESTVNNGAKKQDGNEDVDSEKSVEKAETDKKSDEEEEGKLDPTAIAMEREENLRKIVESKKYFVNIKEKKSGSLKTFLFVFFGALLSGLIALFLLIDTNVVDVNYQLPFRIFGSNEIEETSELEENYEYLDKETASVEKESTANNFGDDFSVVTDDQLSGEIKVYNNQELGISFDYPSNWVRNLGNSDVYEDYDEYSVMLSKDYEPNPNGIKEGAVVAFSVEPSSLAEIDQRIENLKNPEGDFFEYYDPDSIEKDFFAGHEGIRYLSGHVSGGETYEWLVEGKLYSLSFHTNTKTISEEHRATPNYTEFVNVIVDSLVLPAQ